MTDYKCEFFCIYVPQRSSGPHFIGKTVRGTAGLCGCRCADRVSEVEKVVRNMSADRDGCARFRGTRIDCNLFLRSFEAANLAVLGREVMWPTSQGYVAHTAASRRRANTPSTFDLRSNMCVCCNCVRLIYVSVFDTGTPLGTNARECCFCSHFSASIFLYAVSNEHNIVLC